MDYVEHEAAGGFVFCGPFQDGAVYVALARKSGGGFLVPKGHLEAGETIEETALRETREELSLSEPPRLLGKVGVATYTYELPGDDRLHRKRLHLFAFSLPEKAAIRPQLVEGFIEARWLPVSEALNAIQFHREYLERAGECYDRWRERFD